MMLPYETLSFHSDLRGKCKEGGTLTLVLPGYIKLLKYLYLTVIFKTFIELSYNFRSFLQVKERKSVFQPAHLLESQCQHRLSFWLSTWKATCHNNVIPHHARWQFNCRFLIIGDYSSLKPVFTSWLCKGLQRKQVLSPMVPLLEGGVQEVWMVRLSPSFSSLLKGAGLAQFQASENPGLKVRSDDFCYLCLWTQNIGSDIESGNGQCDRPRGPLLSYSTPCIVMPGHFDVGRMLHLHSPDPSVSSLPVPLWPLFGKQACY